MTQADTCLKAQELALMALDPEPGFEATFDADAAFLDKHLLECEACRAYCRTMENLTGSIRQLAPMAVPAGLSDKILARLNTENTATETPSAHKKGSLTSARLGWRRMAPVAAAVLLLALAIPLVLHRPQAPTQVANQTPLVEPAPVSQPQPSTTQLASLPDQVVASSGASPRTTPTLSPLTTQRVQPDNLSVKTAPTPVTSHSTAAPRPVLAMRSSGASSVASASYQAPAIVDATEVASLPQDSEPMGLSPMSSLGSYSSESDVYYDPASSMVGF